jgi:hypothetical protein
VSHNNRAGEPRQPSPVTGTAPPSTGSGVVCSCPIEKLTMVIVKTASGLDCVQPEAQRFAFAQALEPDLSRRFEKNTRGEPRDEGIAPTIERARPYPVVFSVQRNLKQAQSLGYFALDPKRRIGRKPVVIVSIEMCASQGVGDVLPERCRPGP